MKLAGWKKRIRLDIDYTNKIGGSVTQFPVTIFLKPTNGDTWKVFNEVGNNYRKIAITKADGVTELKVEMELWDVANKVGILHTSLANWVIGGDTSIYLYYDGSHYDNPNVGNIASTAGQAVWDSNFKARYSMKDLTTSTIEDSTSNNNDGTKKAANEPIQADGQIAKAQSFDGTDDYITVGTMGNFGSELATNKPTFSCWVKSSVTNKVLSLCGTANDGTTVLFDIKLNCYWDDTVAAGKIRVLLRDKDGKDGKAVNGYVDSNTGITNGNWHHLVVTIDGSNNAIQIILDGVSQSVTYYQKNTPSSFVNFQYPMAIGARNNRGTLDYHFDGIIDEVSFSNTLRPFAWIKASYNSGNDTLLKYLKEETLFSRRGIFYVPINTSNFFHFFR